MISSAVVEDAALITLEKTARRLASPIKSYGRLKFQPLIVNFRPKLRLNRAFYP